MLAQSLASLVEVAGVEPASPSPWRASAIEIYPDIYAACTTGAADL